jgi:hypothetical protein
MSNIKNPIDPTNFKLIKDISNNINKITNNILTLTVNHQKKNEQIVQQFNAKIAAINDEKIKTEAELNKTHDEISNADMTEEEKQTIEGYANAINIQEALSAERRNEINTLIQNEKIKAAALADIAAKSKAEQEVKSKSWFFRGGFRKSKKNKR